MKKVTFLFRSDSVWGGDKKTVLSIAKGMRSLGHSVKVVNKVALVPPSDFVWLSTTPLDIRPYRAALNLMNIPYGVIPFHEDIIKFHAASIGFFMCVHHALKGAYENGVLLDLQLLEESPHSIYYYGYAADVLVKHFINREVLEQAHVCVPNSETEAKTLRRDVPSARIATIPLAPGFGDEFLKNELTDEFLQFTGLKSGEYILQVGRVELRKNQLGTILATRHLDHPLVLIVTSSRNDLYFKTCLEAILKWRKAPTWIISQNMASSRSGPCRILQMPGKKKLSTSMLHSAFGHAGLHLHPAFCELPGFTYLESAILGIPTIASEWASIGDYFKNAPLSDDRIEMVCPYDLKAIEALVKKKFGQKYAKEPLHPVFARSWKDVGREFAKLSGLSI